MALSPPILPTLSICSGVGSLDLAVWLATDGEAQPVLYVEKEVSSAALLAARLEEEFGLAPAPIWSDLLTLDCRPLRGRVAGVVAGIPCQPFSPAGKRRGRSDKRWLGPDLLRVVRGVGAHWLFIEESPAFATAGLPDLVQTLEAWGWRWDAIRVAAEDTGASHRRVRLFVLAMGNGQLERQRPEHLAVLAAGGSDEALGYPTLREWRMGQGTAGPEWAAGGPGRSLPPPVYVPGRDLDLWTELLDAGLVDVSVWPAQSPVRGAADGAPGRLDVTCGTWSHRVRALGDGVCPLAAAVAFRVLVEQLTATHTTAPPDGGNGR